MLPDGNKEEEPLTSDKNPQPDTVPRDDASLGGGATENAEANIGSANLPSIDPLSRDSEEPAVTPPDSIATSASGACPEKNVPEAPADPIFDPHEFIPATSAGGAIPEIDGPKASAPGPIFPSENEHWEDLLAGGAVDFEYVSPMLLELIRPALGLSSLDEFTGFQAGGFTPKTGEYSFQTNSSEFLRLLALAKCTFVAHSHRRGLIKMTVSQTALRAQAYDFAAFSETVLPLKGYATGITKEQPVTFIVPFDDFETACKALDDTVTFTYRPEQARIEIVAGNFERPLVTRSVESFKDFDEATIGALDPGSRRTIDPQLVGAAIDYVAPAVSENQTKEQFNLIEFREGQLVGGSLGAIAVVAAAGLNGLDMRIRYRFIDPVRTVLARLDGQAALFETPRFYIIRDRETAFGFEKPDASFPDVAPMLSPRSVRDRIALDRKRVVHGMLALEAWLGSDAAIARFQCSKGFPQVRCSLMGQREDGKKIKFSLDARRMDAIEDPVVAFFPARMLRAAAEAFDAPQLYMDLYAAEDCLIVTEDEEEEDFHAQTLIAMIRTPNRARSPASGVKGPDQ